MMLSKRIGLLLIVVLTVAIGSPAAEPSESRSHGPSLSSRWDGAFFNGVLPMAALLLLSSPPEESSGVSMPSAQPTVMLIVRGLKSNLPQEEMEGRYQERMQQFRELPGLLQKYYSYDDATGEWAGIYLWDSEESLAAYLESDLRKSIPSAYELIGPPQIDKYQIVDVLRK